MKRQFTVTYDEFDQQARNFAEKAKGLQDGWGLREVDGGPHNGQVYLVKKQVQELRQEKLTEKSSSLEDLAGDTTELSDHGDLATLASRTEAVARTIQVHVEYHIVHSYSYLVPVLYWNASYSDGKQLTLEDIWNLLEEVPTDVDKWGVVTQQEHPHLDRPFYHLHPCHTAEAMGGAKNCLEENSSNNWDFLTSWLSMYGKLVGLKLPLEFAN